MKTEVERVFDSALNDEDEFTINIKLLLEPLAEAVAVILHLYHPFPTLIIDAVAPTPTEPTTPLFKSKFAQEFGLNVTTGKSSWIKLFVFFFAYTENE
jgi:hypothetical protein